MKTQVFVDNIKCGGCAATIRKELKAFSEVTSVNVEPEQELVEIEYDAPAALEKIKGKLSSLGYPEKDTLKGLGKITANMKSYVSCAIGRISPE